MEKVVFDNFFHFFHEFLRKSFFFLRKWWKKLFLTTFSTVFMIPKTSSEIRGQSGKSCQKQLFPRFGPPKRLESCKKLFLTTFSTIFMIPKTSSEIRGKSGKSCQNQLFPRLKLFWRPKSWKKLVLTTSSTISMIPTDFLNNSWKKWKKLAWPTFSASQAVLEAQIVEKVGQANFLRVLPILSMLEEPPHFVLRTRGAFLFIIE